MDFKFSNSFKILSLLFSFLFLFACDVIDEKDRILDVENTDVKKTVLLEDYTGVNCTNCPRAAANAQESKKALKDQLVIVSIHAGPFSTRAFQTEAGKAYQEYFYPENDAYPAGIISRCKFEGKTVSTNDSKWNSYILERIQSHVFPMMVELSLVPLYDVESKNLTVECTVKAFTPINSEIKLQLWVTESHIIAAQKSENEIIRDYEHNHVLRDAVNGIWGETVTIQQNQTVSYSSAPYSLAEKTWKPENMHVVGFLYDAKTMEVLFATEVPLNK